MSDPGNVMGKWNYGTAQQFPYGDETTYRKAMEFLDGPYIIEDWGSGVSWARKFVNKGRYVGLDGSWSMHCDQVVDLRSYRSGADAILLRHVLEHNYDWRKILENALASFQKKLVLVMFTPFSEVTHSIGVTKEGERDFAGGIPDISFRKEDLLELIGKFHYTEESAATGTQYGFEHIFYITREKPWAKPLVSIIIPTFQHLEDLLKPELESLREFTGLSHVEVIVVANGCTDGTEEYVRSLGAPFKVLSFPGALGYTKAMNVGIKAAAGDYLIFLNNDIIVQPQPRNQWIDQLLAPFKDNPKMGVTGPLQFHDYYSEQDLIMGACLCISRKALEAAGGKLDEIYSPGGGEDVDLCCKVRQAGFIVRQVPEEGKPGCQWTNVDGKFMLWHKNNQTFKNIPDYWEKIVKRNGLLNLKRHNRNIKLNLFGKAQWGYVSADDPEDLLASVCLDPTKLDLLDGSVAELLAVGKSECKIGVSIRSLFEEWHRVLRSGGKLTVEIMAGEEVRSLVHRDLLEAGFSNITFKSPYVEAIKA